MARIAPAPHRPTEDLAAWRRAQFSKLGIKGSMGVFLAGTRMDATRIGHMIEKGALPLDAVRIEAGRDHIGEDPAFDHAEFDRLLADTIPF